MISVGILTPITQLVIYGQNCLPKLSACQLNKMLLYLIENRKKLERDAEYT